MSVIKLLLAQWDYSKSWALAQIMIITGFILFTFITMTTDYAAYAFAYIAIIVLLIAHSIFGYSKGGQG